MRSPVLPEVTAPVSTAVGSSSVGRAGLWWGLLGVLAFSLTVPLTRIAVGSFSPIFIAAGRAVVAAALAVLALSLMRATRPTGTQWVRLAVVAGGVVVGFPMLTSIALTAVPAGHAAVVIGLLPAATAVMAVLRGHERPPLMFWIAAAIGAVAAIGFAVASGGGLAGVGWSDLLLFGAVVSAAVGYAEGGLLSRELGSWQTISWALVVGAPPMIVVTVCSVASSTPTGPVTAWLAFAYLAAVSMFLGFFAWYRGLALGPIATVGQVQLVQPVLSIGWAVVLLDETLTPPIVCGALAVIACTGFAVRHRGALTNPSAGAAVEEILGAPPRR